MLSDLDFKEIKHNGKKKGLTCIQNQKGKGNPILIRLIWSRGLLEGNKKIKERKGTSPLNDSWLRLQVEEEFSSN